MAWTSPTHPNGVQTGGGIHKTTTSTPSKSTSSNSSSSSSSSGSSSSKKSGSSSSSSSGSSSTSKPVSSGSIASSQTGGYTIGSAKGQQIANDMKSGSTYNASDGSTWKKNSDGTVSVTTKQGGYTANAYTSPSNSNSSKGGSSSSGGGKSVNVGSSGNAQQGLSMGTIVNTAGGQYKIVDKNTQGASYNPTSGYYSIKVPSASGSNSNSSASNSTPKTVKVGANGKAPVGLAPGTIVETAGGNFRVISVNEDGSYRSEKVGNVNNTSTAQAGNNTKAAVTYQQNGKTMNGYVVDGQTFDAETGQRITSGALVTAGGKQYLMTVDGGRKVSDGYETSIQRENKNGMLENVGTALIFDGKAYNKETGQRVVEGDIIQSKNGNYYKMGSNGGSEYKMKDMEQLDQTPITSPEYTQKNIDAIMELISQTPSLQQGLTLEQAMARAQSQMDPTYNSAINDMMDQMDKTALKSGFYGQLPTEALKRNTAGSLEVQKLQAINELANQLLGQSEDSAYKALNAATTEQQNKINTLLNMLGIYQSERGYKDSRDDEDYNKKLQEAGYTGYYNGKPTLDLLNYQRLNSKAK